MKSPFLSIIEDHEKAIKALISQERDFYDFLEIIRKHLFEKKSKIIACGNGGSACDAQHFVAELVCRFEKERIVIPAISINTDIANITSISNDFNFDYIFSRQLEAVYNENDLLFVISTSGNSQNLIEVCKKANELSLKTIALLGRDGGEVSKLADQSLIIKESSTARIQEMHILIIHLICFYLEKEISSQ